MNIYTEKKQLKTIFVDTAFVIAWVNEDDALHTKAIKLLNVHKDSSWLTTDCVLLEIGNSLSRNFRPEAVETIENFLTSEEIIIVRLDARLFSRAFELYRTYDDKTWGLIDCVSFIVMRENGITDALTNDKHFQQAGFNALMRND